MKNLSFLLKSAIKNNILILAKLLGITLLNKKQTILALQAEADTVFYTEGSELVAPAVFNLLHPVRELFKEKHLTTATSYVWKHHKKTAQAKQLRNGSISLGGKVLDIGFGNSVVAKDLLRPTSRTIRPTKILIAPWSHYWTGYFDYIFFVAFTICRIKALLPPEEFANATVCYPLANLAFEQQILDLLGVKPENVVDSRKTNVVFETCFVGNNDSWFYPNISNILLFKSTIESKIISKEITSKESKRSRIYIQRTGRRKVVNEAALLLVLAKFDIQVITDTARSFTEQIEIYRNASFIMGPHGASFANILWCQPATQLLELFPSTYMPEYFRYLAQVLELKYAAYCQAQPMGNEHSFVNDDITVDLIEVEQYLNLLLN